MGEEKETNSKRGTREGKKEYTAHVLPRARGTKKTVGMRGWTAVPREQHKRERGWRKDYLDYNK